MISSAHNVERRNNGKKQRPSEDSLAGRILKLLETGETIQSNALDVTPQKFTLAIRRLRDEYGFEIESGKGFKLIRKISD